MDMGRNMAMINSNHKKLIEKFPDYVSWNGEKDIRGETMMKIKVQADAQLVEPEEDEEGEEETEEVVNG